MGTWRDRVEDDSAAPPASTGWRDRVQADPETVPDVGYTESALRGGAQGASFGFADEIAGGAGALYDSAKKMSVSDIVKDYIARRNDYRAADHAAEKANPYTYGGAQIGTGVATAFIPGVGLVKGGSALANGAKLLAGGAANGLGLSEADNVADMGMDAAKGAGYAAAAGVVGNVASRAIPNAIETGKYATKKAVEHLRPTPMVARVMGPERLAAVGQEALDSGAIQAGAKAGDTAGRLADIRQKVGAEIGQYIDEAGQKGVQINPAQVAERFENEVIKPLRGQSANRDIVAKLEKQKSEFLDHYLGPDDVIQGPKEAVMSPLQLEEEKRAVQGNINYKTDPSAATEAQMGYATTLKDASEEAINNPAFNDAKAKFSKIADAQKIAERTAGLTDSGTGLLGHLHDINASQLAMDAAMGGEPVTGGLIAAGRAATRGRVNSTLAVGADKVSKFLKNNPTIDAAARGTERLVREGAPTAARQNGEYTQSKKLDPEELIGKLSHIPGAEKFAGAIRESAARSPEALATTHFILSQTEPDYQKAFQE